jgi:hypothetical protein
MCSLSMEGLTKMEMAEWPATATTVGLCTAKGQSEDFCRNFIKARALLAIFVLINDGLTGR